MESRLTKNDLRYSTSKFVTESQKYGKLCDFCEKIFMDYIDIVVLDPTSFPGSLAWGGKMRDPGNKML